MYFLELACAKTFMLIDDLYLPAMDDLHDDKYTVFWQTLAETKKHRFLQSFRYLNPITYVIQAI